MPATKSLTRVLYHLPNGNGTDYPRSKTYPAYLETLLQMQSMRAIGGYSETPAIGFWRAPDGVVYSDEVQIIAVDYFAPDVQPDLDTHIGQVHAMILATYSAYECPQLSVYTLSLGLTQYTGGE